MSNYPNSDKDTPISEQAIVLIDYENLYSYFAEDNHLRHQPDEAICDLSDACRKYLSEQHNVKSSSLAAFADFPLLPSQGREIQRRLYLNGIEPHYVPGNIQRNAAEIQLCIKAVDAIQSRSAIDLLVVLSADRMYLPLAAYGQHEGLDVIVMSFRQPQFSQSHALSQCYVNGQDILSTYTKSRYNAIRVPEDASNAQPAATRSTPVEYKPITNPTILHVLRVIEEHFGQYNDIFLTPLLRKLSEVMGDQHDPKLLINELEEAGAVWLEKRSGYPYDFTVMILDSAHPDVAEVQSVETDHSAEELLDEHEASESLFPPNFDDSAASRDGIIRRIGHPG